MRLGLVQCERRPLLRLGDLSASDELFQEQFAALLDTLSVAWVQDDPERKCPHPHDEASVGHLCTTHPQRELVGFMARPEQPRSFTFFLSHCGPTEKWLVRVLHHMLQRLGVSSFFDQSDESMLLGKSNECGDAALVWCC